MRLRDIIAEQHFVVTRQDVIDVMNNKKWPQELQAEMADEWVLKDITPDSLQFINSLDLQSTTPVQISSRQLLTKKENLESIARSPKEVIDAINQRWKTNVTIGQQYDLNPERYFKYAKLPANTAKPSIMVDGEIIMGSARFIAALLRGDQNIKVWNLKRKIEPI